MRRGLIALWLLLLAEAGIAPTIAPTVAQDALPALRVSSPTLRSGEATPIAHTPDGRNDSPAIEWDNAPVNTKEFAIVCEDPDAGNPPPFVHWVVYRIPGTARGVPAALPIDDSPMPAEIRGAVQG